MLHLLLQEEDPKNNYFLIKVMPNCSFSYNCPNLSKIVYKMGSYKITFLQKVQVSSTSENFDTYVLVG